jgi:hypothetical protein
VANPEYFCYHKIHLNVIITNSFLGITKDNPFVKKHTSTVIARVGFNLFIVLGQYRHLPHFLDVKAPRIRIQLILEV